MTFRDIIDTLRRRWRTVLLCAGLGLAVAGGFALALPKTYEAGTSLYVTATDDSDAAALSQGAAYVQTQMRSYPVLVTSPGVMDGVAAETGMGDPGTLASQVRAEVPPESAILQITASAGDPGSAATLSNSVAKHFSDEVIGLEKRPGAKESPIRFTVVQPATAPAVAASPQLSKLLAVGGLAGLLFGFVVTLLREAAARR